MSPDECPTDGEIYRHIRQHPCERQWWAHLSRHKSKNLRQLLRHDKYTAAFDAILNNIPGLGTGMRISTLHKMMAMRCEEEILCYLHSIKELWFKLLGSEKDALLMVDEATVKFLELKAPGVSVLDANAVHGKLLTGKIFNRFSDTDRSNIWMRMQNVEGLIPSLYSFFEDIKYLEVCADCVKRLVTLSQDDTVYTALEAAYLRSNRGKPLVQITDSSPRPEKAIERVDLGRRELYAFTMRRFIDMPRYPKKKDLLAKSRGTADEVIQREFAELARRLGFDSPEISALIDTKG
jgi:hypothetical protein